jgi:hypothetical protein
MTTVAHVASGVSIELARGIATDGLDDVAAGVL